jgi:hypothetical protein
MKRTLALIALMIFLDPPFLRSSATHIALSYARRKHGTKSWGLLFDLVGGFGADGPQGKAGSETGDTGQAGKIGAMDALVVLYVCTQDLDDVVGVPRHEVA